jgi:hypothetical protein
MSITTNFYKNLNDIQNLLYVKEFDKIEEKYLSLCSELAGIETAKAIASVDISCYQEKLAFQLENIVNEYLVNQTDSDNSDIIKAVYFEYDPDNDWSSSFFLCLDYLPLDEEDDDWACDWEVCLDGPNIPDFTNLNIEEHFLRTKKSLGKVTYAHARVIAAFARACNQVSCPIPICIGYHDQSTVTRIFKDEV